MESGLKHLHMSLALISILGFVLRGGWLLATGNKPANKFARIVPHVVDTLLLLSGIGLLAATAWAFLTMPWMLVKLLMVVAYIGLGIAAFRLAPGLPRLIGFGLAILAFVQVMAIAFNKSPWGLFSFLA